MKQNNKEIHSIVTNAVLDYVQEMPLFEDEERIHIVSFYRGVANDFPEAAPFINRWLIKRKKAFSGVRYVVVDHNDGTMDVADKLIDCFWVAS